MKRTRILLSTIIFGTSFGLFQDVFAMQWLVTKPAAVPVVSMGTSVVKRAITLLPVVGAFFAKGYLSMLNWNFFRDWLIFGSIRASILKNYRDEPASQYIGINFIYKCWRTVLEAALLAIIVLSGVTITQTIYGFFYKRLSDTSDIKKCMNIINVCVKLYFLVEYALPDLFKFVSLRYFRQPPAPAVPGRPADGDHPAPVRGPGGDHGGGDGCAMHVAVAPLEPGVAAHVEAIAEREPGAPDIAPGVIPYHVVGAAADVHPELAPA